MVYLINLQYAVYSNPICDLNKVDKEEKEEKEEVFVNHLGLL